MSEEKKEEAKKRSVVLGPGRFGLAEHKRNEWIVNAPEGAEPNDLKDPAFWAVHAHKLRPFDRIEVRADDGSWLAEAIVLQADRTWARVSVLNTYELQVVDLPEKSDKHEVKYRGPQHKWCVIRLSDSAILKAECSTKVEADAWMREHEKAA